MRHMFTHANANFVTDQLVIGGDLDQDNDLAVSQAVELVDVAGITHVLDIRLEMDDAKLWACLPDVAYRWDGMDDAGQTVSDDWWDGTTAWAADAITSGGRALVHCHLGINRSPSAAFAILLTMGWTPIEALTAIRRARPIANAWYAEQALAWHLKRTHTSATLAAREHRRVAAWRREHPLDVVRVIRDIRTRRDDW